MRALAALLTTLALVAPATARAGVVATLPVPLGTAQLGQGWANGDPGQLVSGPVPAGGGIAWAQEGAAESVDVRVLRPGDGAVPRTVATLPAVTADDDNSHAFQLLGSATRLAWSEQQQLSYPIARGWDAFVPLQDRVQSGPVDGPFTTVVGCDGLSPAATGCAEPPCGAGDAGYESTRTLALSGDALVAAESCTLPPDPLKPSDPTAVSTQTVRTIGPDGATRGATLSSSPGKWPSLAALTPALLLFRPDADHRPALLRTADGAPAGSYPAGLIDEDHTLTLQDDGKLAAIVRRAGQLHSSISWAAPGDGATHGLPGFVSDDTAVGAIGTFRFAGDHILYVADQRGTPALALTDLAGRARTLVTLPPSRSVERVAAVLAGADTDGTTTTWAVTQCERTYVGVSGPGDGPVVFPPAVCDTPRVAAPSRLTVDRRGRVSVGVTCARACHGTLALHSVPYATMIYARFSLPGGPHARPVPIKLYANLRRAVARHDITVAVRVVQQHLVQEQPETLRRFVP
jgi:hypothetical protein